MSRSVDQVPPYNPSDNPYHNQQPQVHPERVPTELGGTTPAYPGWQPQRIETRPANKNKLIALVTLGGVAATGVLGASIYFGIKSAANEQVDRMLGSDRTASAPVLPGETEAVDGTKLDVTTYPYYGDTIHEITPFSELPLGTQIDAVAPYVDSHIQQWHTAYRNQRDEHGGSVFDSETLAPIAADNDAQTVVSRNLAITYARWNDVDPNLAKNLVSAQDFPGTDEYSRGISTIGDGKGTYHSPLKAFGELPIFTEGSFYGVEANGKPTLVTLVMNGTTAKASVNIYQLHTGTNNPDAKAWLLMDAGSMSGDMGTAYKRTPGAMNLPSSYYE